MVVVVRESVKGREEEGGTIWRAVVKRVVSTCAKEGGVKALTARP